MGIIKSYSEFIGESFWGDVHKRSRGDVMRREDAVTYKDLQKEDVTIEQLYRYLIQHYTPIAEMNVEVWPINDIQFYEDPDEQGKDKIVIPVTISGEYIEVEPDSFSPGDIYAIGIPREFVNFAKKEEFDIEKERGIYKAIYNSGVPVKKYQVVDFLDKLLTYVDNPILKKKSSLMESFWGDVHKRSRGDVMRREDIIHYEDLKNEKCTLDILYQYLLQHYTVLGDDKITYDEDKGIEIPVKLENEPITVIPTDHDTVFSIEAPFNLREYIEKSKYVSQSWDEEQCIEVIISEENDDMCCSDVVIFLDELLSLIPTPALKKSEHPVRESFWGDVHKRSIGDEIRQEDELHTNDLKMMQLYKFIKERHPILDQFMTYGATYLPDYNQISLIHYGGKRKGDGEGDFEIKYTRKKKENELVVLVPGGWDTYHKLMDCIKPTKQFTTKTLMEDPKNYIHTVHFRVFQKDKSLADNNLFVRLVDCIVDGLGE